VDVVVRAAAEVLVARGVLALDEGGLPAGCEVQAEATTAIAARSHHHFDRRDFLRVMVGGDAVTVREFLIAALPRTVDAQLVHCLAVPPSTVVRECRDLCARGPSR